MTRKPDKLTVVHVVPTLDPDYGGPAAVVPRLAAAQVALGARVRVVTMQEGPGREAACERALAAIPGIEALEVHRLPRRSGLSTLAGRSVATELDRLLHGADLAHLHGLWEPLVTRAAMRCRKLGLPWVIEPHGMLDPWSLSQRGVKKRVALALHYRRMLEHAAAALALNRDEAEGIARLELSVPVHLLPNGVFLEEVDHPVDQTPKDSDPVVLFMGRLHYKKGLDLLVGAFSRVATHHRRARLHVVGPDDGFASELDRLVEHSGCADRICVLGPRYGDDKLAALRGASLFVLPSRQEGFSMALLEAMASGCPVVTTREAHLPEVAEAEAGWIVPLEEAALADALEHALSDPDELIHRGRNGRRLVEQHFTWPAVARRSIELYHDVLTGRRHA